MKKLLLIPGVLFLAILVSCKHDPSAMAHVKYHGDLPNDSCGYILQIAGQDYHPVNLDPAFQNDTVVLDVTFKYLNSEFICIDTVQEIEIIDAHLHHN